MGRILIYELSIQRLHIFYLTVVVFIDINIMPSFIEIRIFSIKQYSYFILTKQPIHFDQSLL